MMRQLFFSFVGLFCFVTSIHATQDESHYNAPIDLVDPLDVKVLIRENADGALIDVKGAYKVLDPNNNRVLSSGTSKKRFFLHLIEDGIKWGECFYGIHQLKIVPAAAETTILVDGIQYAGSLEFYEVDGSLQIVNEVDSENFLKSTLSQEFAHTEMAEAAMEALAIAARTNLYHKVLSTTSNYWQLSANKENYKGYATTLINFDVDRSINATRGLILTHKNRPFPTSWSENCGGQTASYSDIFRKSVVTPEGIKVPLAQLERDKSHWKYTISKASLAEKIGLAKLTGIDAFHDTQTGKIYGVRFTGGDQTKEMSYFELGGLIGKDGVKSTDFTIKMDGDFVVFEGFGVGPGVGLCLFSADQMAKVGDSTPQILANFYPTTNLIKLQEEK